jgi:hypothetical protein
VQMGDPRREVCKVLGDTFVVGCWARQTAGKAMMEARLWL